MNIKNLDIKRLVCNVSARNLIYYFCLNEKKKTFLNEEKNVPAMFECLICNRIGSLHPNNLQQLFKHFFFVYNSIE